MPICLSLAVPLQEECNCIISGIGSVNVEGRVYFNILRCVSGIFFPVITFNLTVHLSAMISCDFDPSER